MFNWLFLISILTHLTWAGPQNGPMYKVVIDPGHGGADTGTIHKDGKTTLTEKEITLSLAHAAAAELRGRGYAVFLTRTQDKDLALQKRTDAANRLGADLFISIHLNSTQAAGEKGAYGIETYILNNTSDAPSKRLAYFENNENHAQGADGPTSEKVDVALILKDLRLDANLSESKRLACTVQNQWADKSGLKNRGVKQALFYVLLGADMPSILIEAGFLSNPKDRAFLSSIKGQKTFAKSLADSIDEFKRFKNTRQALNALSRCKVHEHSGD